MELQNPLKTATTVLSEEKSPTVSLTVPLKNMIEQSKTLKEEDLTTFADIKSVILSKISGQYSGYAYYFLPQRIVLDTSFGTAPHPDPSQHDGIFFRIQKKGETATAK